jgi:dCMP deaminase
MRKPWDKYFSDIAQMVSERATCTRLHVGCVLVKDKRIISTGYNGSISGDEHCEDVGCYVVDGHCIRTIHAERNALAQCARHGIATDGATAYITHFPCLDCAKMLIQAGVKRIVYGQSYRDSGYVYELAQKAGVTLEGSE